MSNTTIGLLLLTPMVWSFLGAFVYDFLKWKMEEDEDELDDNTKTRVVSVLTTVIVLALWGVYFLL